jgi:predicted flap endonuclease-1-like 5' DNA nuclease
MMTVVDANILPIIIAVVIGFIIGWWMFRRSRAASARSVLDRDDRKQRIDPPAEAPPPVRPYMRGRPIRDGIDTVERGGTPRAAEGRGVADEGAAAMRDVAGEVLGVSGETQHPSEQVADDLQMLKGVGPKLAQKLNENGIFRFEQIAALSANEVAILDGKLGPFKGRLDRDRVVEQASYLARGDRDGFEGRFGKLGSG